MFWSRGFSRLVSWPRDRLKPRFRISTPKSLSDLLYQLTLHCNSDPNHVYHGACAVTAAPTRAGVRSAAASRRPKVAPLSPLSASTSWMKR